MAVHGSYFVTTYIGANYMKEGKGKKKKKRTEDK